MAKLPGDKFLELLRRSELVDNTALDKSLAELSAKKGEDALADGDIVSDHLVNAGVITNWQRDKLMEGRHKGFFIGKYKLLSLLGAGGMSHVYLAEHRHMRRRVAIKVLPKSRVNNSSYLDRFYLEARAAAALDHANIVRAYDVDFDEEQNVHYMVMEYVEGRDLQNTVKQRGPLPFHEAAEYIRQAAEGLTHAHGVGLVHRDIKPANLLLDPRGTVKVLDMGLARFEVAENEMASLTMAHEENVLGTADYLAPEQAINSHKVDGRADIYSLGCTLYYLLTGSPPFPEGTLTQRLMKHQSAEPEAISKLRPDAPKEILAICRKMMAKKREDRYQSADEVKEAMTGFLTNRRNDSGVLENVAVGANARVGGSDSNLRNKRGGDSSGSNPSIGDAAPGSASPFQDTAPNLMPTIKVSTGLEAEAGGLPQIDTGPKSKRGPKPGESSKKLVITPAKESGPGVVNVHDAATLPEVRMASASTPSGKVSPSGKSTATAPAAPKKRRSSKALKPPGLLVYLSIGTVLVLTALMLAMATVIK